MVAPTLTLSRQREEVAPRPIVKKRQAVAGSGWEAAAVVERLGGGGAVVVVLQVQFIDKVVDVLMQLKFQQSRVCTGSSSTECWTFQLRTERYPQCKLCGRLFLRRRPCDQQRQVPTVQRFESSCPRFSSSSVLCNRFRRIPQVQFLDKVEICPLLRRQVQFLVFWAVVDMPVCVQRQVLDFR